jgi:energy-coupling factor transporter ATP-binding protein EcfA2
MFKLRWLQINKYRSVKPGTRLVFNADHNVLLGQNGTGKTTLLNLVAAVVTSNFTDIWDEEFDLEYQLVSGQGAATATIAARKRHGAAELKAALGLLSRSTSAQLPMFSPDDLQAPEFSADVELVHRTGEPLSIRMELRGGQAKVSSKLGTEASAPRRVTSHFREELLWANALTGMMLGAGEKAAFSPQEQELRGFFIEVQLRRFDESLEFFNTFRTASFDLVRSGEKAVELVGENIPAPHELIQQLVEAARGHWRSDQYVIKDEHLPFLGRVTRLLGFDKAEVVVQLQEAGAKADGEQMLLGGLRFLFSRGPERISDEYLSYGQKRMLAFSYYLASTRSVAIADELVNGLHHAWIRACLDELGQRQVFLTSQNPLLLDDFPFDSAQQVQSTFILCRKERVGEHERMVWENMSQEAAEDFFDSYKVGFQQVGELLQAKGLW